MGIMGREEREWGIKGDGPEEKDEMAQRFPSSDLRVV